MEPCNTAVPPSVVQSVAENLIRREVDLVWSLGRRDCLQDLDQLGWLWDKGSLQDPQVAGSTGGTTVFLVVWESMALSLGMQEWPHDTAERGWSQVIEPR